jgi:site-specific recombinase XerD
MARYFRSPPRVPTTAEVEACLTLLDTQATARNHVLIAMAAMTGLRLHELVALDWGQLVTDGGSVRHRVVLVPEHTKANVGGEVVLPERLRWKLGQYRTWCARRGQSVEGDAPVFVSRNHQRVSVRRVQQVWKAVQIAAYIDRPYKLHALRHYYGTTVYRATKDIRVTQVAMRHVSVSSTMIYTHVSQKDVEQAVERAF